MLQKTLVVAVTLMIVSTTAVAIDPASDSDLSNESPLADAGLDQEVTKGATVLLDGTGSRDPDGRIERYRWTIRTPDNATVTPDCPGCARTRFTPSSVGRYRVTLTVTDDDGATSSDTLYVEVSPGTDPEVSISGPQQPTEGNAVTYTATVDAGTAALDYVVWTMDGTEIANHSLSPSQETDATSKRFPIPGERSVSATVYDVDGQSGTSSLSVAVQREPESREAPGTRRSLADRHEPTVTGDTLITGAKPLGGHYELQLNASTGNVTSVEWRNAAGPVASGWTLTRTWEPGDHQLYALVTYDDGSEDVATFSDGTTSVVADPRPDVSVSTLDRYGSITGSASGLDEYGNLDTLHVEVDGKIVGRARSTVRGRNRLDAGRQQTFHFSHEEFTPGERYSVTLVATDERGQTTEVRREIVPVKRPEIVRSEFVNGPVDSYHERLDPDRYAAHHVLEIDLNGVDPENVSVSVRGGNGVINVNKGNHTQRRTHNEKKDVFVLETYWTGSNPDVYEVDAEYEVKNKGGEWWREETSRFKITPSKPELRLDVLNDGTKKYITREHGILVNASGSFDPDGTDLKYLWKYGAEPTKPDNTTAKFRAYERAASIVEDQYELRTKRNFDFLSYFIPDVENETVLTDGPYFPNETVRVKVETEAYHFSKQTYYDDFELGISVSNPKSVVTGWSQVKAPDSQHSSSTEDAYRYAGVVEIPASELSSSSESPTITVYNEDNSRKTATVDVPDANVLRKDGNYWSNVTVRNLTYVVEKPEAKEATADSNETRDEYLEEGYSVDTKQYDTEYILEKRVQTQEAKYEQVTKDFKSKTIRNLFLNGNLDWYPAGTTREKVTRTKTTTEWYDADTLNSRSEWHDSNLWNGEYTGRSKRVLLHSAVYQTQYQYEYEYEVEKTGTRTVTRTRTVTVQKTGTRTVTECTLRFGCYEKTQTYTYTSTETYTYTITQTYTYTVTRTKTYWADKKLASSHQHTGKTRHVKVEDAEYETRYEVEQKSQYKETVTRYVAAKDELVQPAQYEWQRAQSTNNSMLARQQAASNDDWRIGETITGVTWVLSKQTGTVQIETSQYVNESRVVETKATVEGDVAERYYNLETDEKVTKTVREESKRYESVGAKDRREIIDEVAGPEDNENECKLKGICG